MGQVEKTFIQALEHRPKLSITKDEGIPLIDLSQLNTKDPNNNIDDLVLEISNACKKWGFFQVINHGVPFDKCQKIENASKEFFAQSLDEKRKVRKAEKNALGYYETEHTKNVRDWKEVFDFSIDNPTLVPISPDLDDNEVVEMFSQWPHHPSQFREACGEYAKEVEKLAFKLLELIALSLGLPANKFHDFTKDQTSFIRLNHYPACPAPGLALGVGRHRDGGALTILGQDDVGGLEVKRKSDGEWVCVQPTPNAFVINIGEIIEVWSNGAYESVEHRVVLNSEKERFSIPFFVNPSHYTMVKPLDELTNEPKYEEYNWGKFFITKICSKFKNLDVENIQIQHLKVSLSINK